jgi:hypothetical protein
MKAAMLSGQEADDEKLSWRVDAEVRLRLEEVRREETARSAALQVTSPPPCLHARPADARAHMPLVMRRGC